MPLDPIDVQIVACLIDDARASFQSIGRAVSLSAPAVKRRVDRLRDSGVITGFSARVDENAWGRPFKAFVSVSYDGNVSPAQIRSLLEPLDHVVAAYTVSGTADVLVEVRAADAADFEYALETVRGTGVVAHTESTVVLSTLIDRAARR